METLKIDFLSGALAHRLRYGGGRGQAIGRALGFKPGQELNVVDATAGLGRDSFVMASLGARVTMIERAPKLHAELAAGLEAAKSAPEVAEIIARMTLLFGDAKEHLPQLAPEVVYIDPMHPPRKSSALVKQDLRMVREIVGGDDDQLELLQVALAHAKKRVVLKWPRKADRMKGAPAPSHQIIGKNTRFDVYMTHRSSAEQD